MKATEEQKEILSTITTLSTGKIPEDFVSLGRLVWQSFELGQMYAGFAPTEYTMAAECERLRAMLMEVIEIKSGDEKWDRVCPKCGNYARKWVDIHHAPDCELAALLGEKV